MEKYYVNSGPFQGETVATKESIDGKDTVRVTLIDDHGKNLSDEEFPIPVGFLEPMSKPM